MASDSQTFRVSIPSKNKFLVGPVAVERAGNKPIENLRPQHLLDALLWPEIRKEETVLFEEFNDENARYYVLTVLRGGYRTEILRKIWFDRADLQVARLQSFGPRGFCYRIRAFPIGKLRTPAKLRRLAERRSVKSRANNFRTPSASNDRTTIIGSNCKSRKITLNDDFPLERFRLEQPVPARFNSGRRAQRRKT